MRYYAFGKENALKQKMTLWRKHNHWHSEPLEFGKMTARDFEAMAGQPIVVEWQDVHRRYFGYGTDKLKTAIQGKYHNEELILMDMPAFAHYWQYKLLEYGIDTFTRIEMREEREAIMAVEGVPEAEIQAHLEARPDLYAWPEDF